VCVLVTIYWRTFTAPNLLRCRRTEARKLAVARRAIEGGRAKVEVERNRHLAFAQRGFDPTGVSEALACRVAHQLAESLRPLLSHGVEGATAEECQGIVEGFEGT
jgi:hypothetical protein